jgi:hypothetical protein
MLDRPSRVRNKNIPTYLPLAEAAEKFGLSEKVLTQMIQAGKIEAVQLPSGELFVAAENNGNGHGPKTKDEIIAEKFAQLRGRKISASEASRKYSKEHGILISNELFSRWSRLGYIKREDTGYRLQLDEADVAYCASIYAGKYVQYNGQLQGVNIFDKDGNPYQIKHEDIAEQKRVARRERAVQATSNGK